MRRPTLDHTPDPQAPEVDEHARVPAESEVSMALGAAFLGTLVLGQFVGAQSHWEVLLLALVAALGFVFENLAPRWMRKRRRWPGVR